jgi:hypothetical protein
MTTRWTIQGHPESARLAAATHRLVSLRRPIKTVVPTRDGEGRIARATVTERRALAAEIAVADREVAAAIDAWSPRSELELVAKTAMVADLAEGVGLDTAASKLRGHLVDLGWSEQ